MYAFIDLETSGGKFNKEKIIEIAIIIYNGKKIIESYSTLVNPCIKVDFYVQKLTGIKNSDLEKENTFNHYAKKVLNLVKDKILVGHNVEYDYRILKNELKSRHKMSDDEAADFIQFATTPRGDLPLDTVIKVYRERDGKKVNENKKAVEKAQSIPQSAGVLQGGEAPQKGEKDQVWDRIMNAGSIGRIAKK